MTRFLLGIAAIVILGLMIRSALLAAVRESKQGGQGRGPSNAPRRGRNLPPDRLVCGVCSESFDPEKTGWICPKCGK